jgi:hypothetical protein
VGSAGRGRRPWIKDGNEFSREELGILYQNLPVLVVQASNSINFSAVNFLAIGRYESKSALDSNLQTCLVMRQGWIIFSIEAFGEFVKPLRQVSLREKVREDALQRSPR